MLPNGCRCSQLKVVPANWKEATASLKVNWFIRYRFYSPGEKPKQVVIKAGINGYKTLKERRDAVRFLLEEEMRMLRVDGANPQTGQEVTFNMDGLVQPNTPFLEALHIALTKLDCEKHTREDIESVLRYFGPAARQIRCDTTPISRVTRKEILFTLQQCSKNKKTFTANTFNHYRKYLGILFTELVEMMAIDINPVYAIKKKDHVAGIRETLPAGERKRVDDHLRKKGLTSFRLFIRIFFQSGARITEILKVKGNQVNLKDQWFIVTIKKGRSSKQVKKTIRNSAMPYWKLIMRTCKKDDFVFGRGLVPGPQFTTASQITRRWDTHVKADKEKGGLGITADFYSLKHANTTETSSTYGEHAAADQNSHTTTAMVVKIYDTSNKDRKHEELKKIAVSFT